MSVESHRITVAFDERTATQLDSLCRNRGTTRRAVIRDAINEYLDRATAPPENLRRVAMLREFSQVALDILIREHVPEYRDELLATVKQRMETFHA